MFNVLVSADETEWESGQRMSMLKSRFTEYSGDEAVGIDLSEPSSLDVLERVRTLLLYENGVGEPNGHIVRVGRMRSIQIEHSVVSFRFVEEGRISYDTVYKHRVRLQMTEWEFSRTHWAIKDGDIPQDVFADLEETPRTYDVVLSFAGEDRKYVEDVAEYLAAHEVDVFYDRYEESTLWGKDLAIHFDGIYRKFGRFCVMFISKHYAEKVWTRHESRSAFSRALEEKSEYILPARFDDTEIPGLRPSIAHLDLRSRSPDQLGRCILEKLGRK